MSPGLRDAVQAKLTDKLMAETFIDATLGRDHAEDCALAREAIMEAISSTLEAEQQQRARLEELINDYDAAADKFIAKVETGRAHSRETYADLKACRLQSKAELDRLSGDAP